MTPNVVYALYMLVCVILAVAVWRLPLFDLRGLSQTIRRPPRSLETDDAGFEGEAERIEAAPLELHSTLPRADLLVLTALGGTAGLLLAGAIGWLTPLTFSQPLSDGSPSLLGDRPMERLAQVIGALCFAAIGLRMIRVFMLLGALAAATLVTLLAANFVLGRGLLAGPF